MNRQTPVFCLWIVWCCKHLCNKKLSLWRMSSNYPRKLVRISAVIFAINTWFNILVIATYLPVRLTPKIFHLSVSHRKFLANWCVYEPANAGSFFVIINCMMLQSQNVARRFCESSRHISRLYNLQSHQQRFAYTISNQKPHIIYKHIFALYVSQNVTAGYIPPPIFVYIKYVLSPTTLCLYNRSPQKHNK